MIFHVAQFCGSSKICESYNTHKMKHISLEVIRQLSKRERQILECISEGLTSKEIACRLFLSKNTVDTHRRNMIRKQAARNCAELIMRDNIAIYVE